MKPVSFPEANGHFVMPGSTEEEPIGKLPVCSTVYEDGTPVMVSCWEDDNNERVWLSIIGTKHPPVSVMRTSPFPIAVEPNDVGQ